MRQRAAMPNPSLKRGGNDVWPPAWLKRYLHCPQGLIASKAGEAMLGKAGRGVTTRNRATVLKLEALLSAA